MPAAARDNKITSIRRWKQAFRAYATIYCGANPQRSKEIWQYIAIINIADASYSWDNVYNYDITFRHLMAFNPQRSWVVTYNQMWNLSMRDPLPKGGNRQQNSYHSFGSANSNSRQDSNHSNGNGKRKKSDYCWNFNKGIKCKFGVRCRFIERCSYCDSPNHGIHVCPKAAAKGEGPGNGAAGNPAGNNQAGGAKRSEN